MSAAEDMSYCADSSVDLVTSAQAMHWYNLEDFYAETRRALKPNGVLAVCGYTLPVLEVPEATQLIHQMANDTLRGYFNPNIEILDKKYESITLPFRDFQR